jgi:hypothetical protein
MSNALYLNYKSQTDAMIARHDLNVLTGIELSDFVIVDVDDFIDGTKDSFVVLMKGSMVDYHVDDRDNKITSGNANKSQEFKELWKFIRAGNNWVVDDIKSEVSLADLEKLHAYSEKVNRLLS